MKKNIMWLIIAALLVTGCVQTRVSEENAAEKLLKDKGYKIISQDGKIDEYTLSADKLLKLPYELIWGVQNIDAADYLGKKILTYGFTIKNHPLDNLQGNDNKRTKAYVMVCEGRIIGGYSLPDNDSCGGFYSLDGKTLEEVTGLSLKEWSDIWNKKFVPLNQNKN